jgi:hypothetical protein
LIFLFKNKPGEIAAQEIYSGFIELFLEDYGIQVCRIFNVLLASTPSRLVWRPKLSLTLPHQEHINEPLISVNYKFPSTTIIFPVASLVMLPRNQAEGRERKLGAMLGCLVPGLVVGMILVMGIFLWVR